MGPFLNSRGGGGGAANHDYTINFISQNQKSHNAKGPVFDRLEWRLLFTRYNYVGYIHAYLTST